MRQFKWIIIAISVIMLINIAGCKKDGLKYVGTWAGTTDENNPISIVVRDVGDEGLITGFTFTGSCSSQSTSLVYDNSAYNLSEGKSIYKKHFTIIAGEESSGMLTISGDFKRKSLSGTYKIKYYAETWYGWQQNINECESSGTYTASLQE